MAAEYKASFLQGYYYYLMEGCLQNHDDGYKPFMEVMQPTKNTLAWASLLNHGDSLLLMHSVYLSWPQILFHLWSVFSPTDKGVKIISI